MSRSHETNRRLRIPALGALVAAAVAFQGCVPYTSNYKPDPTRSKRVVRIDDAAATAGKATLAIESAPDASNPAAPALIRVTRKRSGPGLEISTVAEQRYRYYWTPAIIPVGLIGIAVSPALVVLSPLINAAASRGPNPMTVFGGWDPKGCQPAGLMLGYLIFSVGHVPTCEPVGEPRITETATPAGRNLTEEAPVSGATVRVAAVEPEGRPGEGIVIKTNAEGIATAALPSVLTTLPDSAKAAELVAWLESDPKTAARTAVPPKVVDALMGPVRDEHEGDRAAAAGKGLIALESYVRAARNNDPADGNPGLWKKIVEAYRAASVKPPVPEDARRLLVQAKALAEANDADGAISKFREAIRTTPWIPAIRFNLAQAQAMNRDYNGAIASMNRYIELAPDSPDVRHAKDQVYEWEALRPAETPNDGADRGTKRPLPPGSRRR